MHARLARSLHSHRAILLVTAWFVVLMLYMTWPLAPQMDRAVIGWVGDNYNFVWRIGWFEKALFALNHSPLDVPILNYPEGYNLAYTDLSFTLFMALPISLPTNPTLAYNLTLLISFVLSGLGVFLWVRRLSRNAWAGAVAGTLFAFAPYRMSHLYGHLNLMGTQWFPLYFMGLHDLLSSEKRSWRSIGWTSVFLVLIGLTSLYYLYMGLLLSVAYVVGYVLLVKREPPSIWELAKRSCAVGAMAIPFLLLAILPTVQAASQNSLRHTFEAVRLWSASPTDFILPSPRHWLWGAWVEAHLDRSLWIESTLYVGAVTLGLAAVALVRHGHLPVRTGLIRLLVGMSLTAFVLALGVELRWLGQPVIVDVPSFIQQWHPYEQTFIPLPGYFLFKFLPFYAGMRVWMRYGILVSLFVSVVAGIGAAWLFGRVRHRLRSPLAALLLLLVLIDFGTGLQPLSPVEIRPVDAWLRLQPDHDAFAQFPFWQAKSSQIALATLFHDHPFIGDPFGAFAPPQFRRISPILSTFPSQDSVALLRELNMRWIIVDSSQYSDFARVHETIVSLGLDPVAEIEGQYVYELK